MLKKEEIMQTLAQQLPMEYRGFYKYEDLAVSEHLNE